MMGAIVVRMHRSGRSFLEPQVGTGVCLLLQPLDACLLESQDERLSERKSSVGKPSRSQSVVQKVTWTRDNEKLKEERRARTGLG